MGWFSKTWNKTDTIIRPNRAMRELPICLRSRHVDAMHRRISQIHKRPVHSTRDVCGSALCIGHRAVKVHSYGRMGVLCSVVHNWIGYHFPLSIGTYSPSQDESVVSRDHFVSPRDTSCILVFQIGSALPHHVNTVLVRQTHPTAFHLHT